MISYIFLSIYIPKKSLNYKSFINLKYFSDLFSLKIKLGFLYSLQATLSQSHSRLYFILFLNSNSTFSLYYLGFPLLQILWTRLD